MKHAFLLLLLACWGCGTVAAANIQDVFNEFGVQIMSPQYVEDPPQPKVVPADQWYAAPAAKPGP